MLDGSDEEDTGWGDNWEWGDTGSKGIKQYKPGGKLEEMRGEYDGAWVLYQLILTVGFENKHLNPHMQPAREMILSIWLHKSCGGNAGTIRSKWLSQNR